MGTPGRIDDIMKRCTLMDFKKLEVGVDWGVNLGVDLGRIDDIMKLELGVNGLGCGHRFTRTKMYLRVHG